MIHVGSRTKSLRGAFIAPNTPLPFDRMFYPYGFPILVRSNHLDIMKAAGQSWSCAQQSYEEAPIELRISVSKHTNRFCPPAPVWYMQRNLFVMMANSRNFGACDLSEGVGSAWLTATAVTNSAYLRHYFVEDIAHTLLESLHLLTVDASCVAKDGQGVLIVGEPEVGKRSLAYACACRGWTYISEETSCFARRQAESIVIGNPRRVDLPPEAGMRISDYRAQATSPRGESTMPELPAESPSNPRVARKSTVDYIVLVRREKIRNGSAHLLPASREEARRRLLPDIWPFEPSVQEERLATIERLLQACTCEMSYNDLDAAIDLLEHLLRRGPGAPAFRS